MPDKKTSDEDSAAALTGTELFRIVQTNTKKLLLSVLAAFVRNGVSAAEMSYLMGATSNIQLQINTLNTANDAIANRATFKKAVRAAVGADVAALAGEQTLGGVVLVDHDEVLLFAQLDQTKNGYWVISAGAWQRREDFDDATADNVSGCFVTVQEGTYKGKLFKCTNENPIVIGLTNITFEIYNSVVTQSLADGPIISWNMNSGRNAEVTLGGNRTLSIANLKETGIYYLRVSQDGVGNRTLTLPAAHKVAGGGGGAVTLSTAAGRVDILELYYDGITCFWKSTLHYS